MNRISCFAAIVMIAFLLVSCADKETNPPDPQAGSPDNASSVASMSPDAQNTVGTESTPSDSQANAQENGSAAPVAPAFLGEVGKTYAALKAEFPSAVSFYTNLPDAAAVCFGDETTMDYAYYLYGTQFLEIDAIDNAVADQLKCAGFATTVAVAFPQADETMQLEAFFSVIGVSEYHTLPEYYESWLTFQYLNFEVYIDTSMDSVNAQGDFTSIEAIKGSYPVVLIDLTTNAQNHELLKDYF